MNLALAHLSVLMCRPPEVARLAAVAGFTHIGVRVLPATPTESRYPLTPGSPMLRETKTALDDHGIAVLDIEALNLDGAIGRDEWLPQLEVGAALGADVLNIIGSDPDRARLTDSFGLLAADAEQYGIVASLEPSSFQPLDRMEAAQDIVRAVGRGGVMLDVLHFNRVGQSPADLDHLDTSLLTMVQLCDGPTQVPATRAIDQASVPMNQSVSGSDRQREARLKRLLPDRGKFNVDGLLRRIPPTVPISVEVPDPVEVQSVGPERWVQTLATAGARVRRRQLAAWSSEDAQLT